MMILHKKAEAVFIICMALICSAYGVCSDTSIGCANDQCCYIDLPKVNGDGGDETPVQDCYDSGDSVTLTCTGTLNGPPFNNCNGGTWQFPFPSTCESVSGCLEPSIPDNGAINPVGPVDLYTRVYYSCASGYSLVGPSSAVCESGGVWNPTTTPSCQAECTIPSLVNGYVTPNWPTYENGEVLTYSYNDNYTLVGISTTTCRDGVFDPSNKPTCYENCPILSSSFDNGVRSGDSSPYYHHETVSYTCNTGYTLEGSSQIMCVNGAWSDSEPVCRDTCSGCTETQCCYADLPGVNGDGGEVHPVQDCYDNGDGVIMNCTGTLNGPPFNNCIDGTWQFPFPSTCEGGSSCPRPTVPTNGAINPDEPESALYTRVYYSCADGYSLVGQSSAVCESGGVWNPATTPSCQAECTRPSLVNGYVTPNQATYKNGEVLTYSCNDKYTLVGISTTTCRDGVFDPPNKPTCYADCTRPSLVNGYVTPNQPTCENGEVLTYSCNDNYTLVGFSTTTCSDGAFDPPNQPTCTNTAFK